MNKAFDKIKAGLEDASAYLEGDTRGAAARGHRRRRHYYYWTPKALTAIVLILLGDGTGE